MSPHPSLFLVVDSSSACVLYCLADDAGLACFLPPGRYLVSAPIVASQTVTSGPGAGINLVAARFRPNVLLGSTAALHTDGHGRGRPTIVLKSGSQAFQNASNPANVLKITNAGGYDEDTSMNQVIRQVKCTNAFIGAHRLRLSLPSIKFVF